MHTFGFVVSGLFLLAELVAFFAFIGILFLSKRDRSAKDLQLSRHYLIAKGLMICAIAYPAIAMLAGRSFDAINPFTLGYALVALLPVLVERLALKQWKSRAGLAP